MNFCRATVWMMWLFSLTSVAAEETGFFLCVGGVDEEVDGHKVEGKFGTIHRSVDGVNWEEVFRGGPVKEGFNHAKNNLLRCLTYGNGRFVATGNPQGVVVSEDGVAWSVVSSPYGSMSVEFGNGVFLAPNASDFMRSADGITWEVLKADADFPIWGADGAGHVRKTVFGNGVFVCLGESRLGVTRDGSSWEHHEIFPKKEGPGRSVLLFGNGRFVLLSESWGVRVSRDGIEWNECELDSLHTGEGKFGSQGVFTGREFFASAPIWNEPLKQLYRSLDGLSWERAAESKDAPHFSTSGNGLLLGNLGYSKSFKVSSDGGKSWREVKAEVPSRKVYFFDGRRIIGQSGG